MMTTTEAEQATILKANHACGLWTHPKRGWFKVHPTKTPKAGTYDFEWQEAGKNWPEHRKGQTAKTVGHQVAHLRKSGWAQMDILYPELASLFDAQGEIKTAERVFANFLEEKPTIAATPIDIAEMFGITNEGWFDD